ncbi:hypothetical protein EI555_013414 [Monodon monoceros]|uniref:Uncharacterized protein n=1 Tax=Monodon monoceros TaxID=40151 RepID=A0A4U1EZJ2_MONMO|nr:hypothetical protein EI555_013414 [Monodon monoceros]
MQAMKTDGISSSKLPPGAFKPGLGVEKRAAQVAEEALILESWPELGQLSQPWPLLCHLESQQLQPGTGDRHSAATIYPQPPAAGSRGARASPGLTGCAAAPQSLFCP